MPAASDRVTFEGRRTTRRTVAMLQEARRLYGKGYPAISQGGFNAGGVRASAGTHDRDALDFATAHFSEAQCRRWEECLWKVGFAAWWRRYIFNVWPQHHHAVPKGGDISSGAAAQVRAFRNLRDGLAGNRAYPRIGGYAGRTWEQYKAGQASGGGSGKRDLLKISGKFYPDVAGVSVTYLQKSWRSGKFSRHTYLVQVWLRRLGFYKAARDGVPGPKTKAAFDAFRRSLGWSKTDSTGLPGLRSVTLLRDRAKSPRKVVS